LVSGVPEVMSKSSVGFRTMSRDARAISRFSIAWVLALVVVPGVRVYLLFVGFGVSPETPVLLPLYLITGYAVTVLPLTPGGVGVAEATSTLVFVSLGYSSAVVVPVVILDRLLGSYLPALAGWYPAVTTNFGDVRTDV